MVVNKDLGRVDFDRTLKNDDDSQCDIYSARGDWGQKNINE